MVRWGQGATSTRGLERDQKCVSMSLCMYKCAWRRWYLRAMPGQNLPFTAGQRDLLLDRALKFIWK